ncbi:MAG: Lrp/AsnC family transcriptional regulator [Candidatus Thermoplasmatota archaeon]
MKNNTEIITDDEKKVLDALEKNGKESIDEIAKTCGFSRQKVWRIVKHFEENKIIWGYVGIENETVKGLRHFVLLVKRSTLPFEPTFKKKVIFEKVETYLPGEIKVEDIYYTHGRYNAVVTFQASDLIIAKKFIQELQKKLGAYLEEYLLLETLFPVRKRGLKNPNIKEFLDFL